MPAGRGIGDGASIGFLTAAGPATKPDRDHARRSSGAYPPKRERVSSQSSQRRAAAPRPPRGKASSCAARPTARATGHGHTPVAAGQTVMVGFLIGALTSNDSPATQVGPDRWALHSGLGPEVNHT